MHFAVNQVVTKMRILRRHLVSYLINAKTFVLKKARNQLERNLYLFFLRRCLFVEVDLLQHLALEILFKSQEWRRYLFFYKKILLLMTF